MIVLNDCVRAFVSLIGNAPRTHDTRRHYFKTGRAMLDGGFT
jgi:hypothetical protein